MPQFDSFSFLNQVAWVLFFFFNFYFLATLLVFASTGYHLKFRTKKRDWLLQKQHHRQWEPRTFLQQDQQAHQWISHFLIDQAQIDQQRGLFLTEGQCHLNPTRSLTQISLVYQKERCCLKPPKLPLNLIQLHRSRYEI